jgi:hypothetical protein
VSEQHVSGDRGVARLERLPRWWFVVASIIAIVT